MANQTGWETASVLNPISSPTGWESVSAVNPMSYPTGWETASLMNPVSSPTGWQTASPYATAYQSVPGEAQQENIYLGQPEKNIQPSGPPSAEAGQPWWEQVRSWTDYYRKAAKLAFGLGDEEAEDPMVQLQRKLEESYEAPELTATPDFEDMLDRRQQAMELAMEEQAAGRGVPGAFEGVASEAERARGALASAAQAAYKPKAWQQQQKINAQMNRLLNALAGAEMRTEAAIRGAGYIV